MFPSKIIYSFLTSVCLALCPIAMLSADIFNYGDFNGDNVDFQSVLEIAPDDVPLFGAPTVDGNTLDFIVPGFVSESLAGASDLLNGRLRFTVVADAGFLIDSISLDEFGAYVTVGDTSYALVSAVAFVEVDGQLYDETLMFDTSGNSNGGWAEGLVLDFPNAQQVSFIFDNTLFTRADALGASFIDKNGLSISVNLVPEPSTAMLVGGIALVLIPATRRRRVV